ncbi:MAG: class I SAM-dependent methyltransferase, partial [Saprospiraceae bacterium]|nr:class I SAM-dependent methyltransferase [Saprospiraceae bacterium]
MNKLYREWYQTLFLEVPDLCNKKIVELGSGGGFLKELAPSVITSDYLDLQSNDLSFSALDMPFGNEEIDALFMIDTFHHIPEAKKFLSESHRVLRSGGKLIMIEPANSTWGRFIYKNFHHEPFQPEGDWTISDNGPLSGANGALPWIVFE